MTPRQKKRARAKRVHASQKAMAKMRRVHHYVATVLKPDWNYHELLSMICERLPNKTLIYLANKTRKDRRASDLEAEYASNELMERQVLLKPRISADDEAIAKHNVPKHFTYDRKFAKEYEQTWTAGKNLHKPFPSR